MPRTLRATHWFCGAFTVLFAALAASARADAPHVMPTGTLPPDHRLGELKDLDGYFPLEVKSTPEAWKDRAEHVRRQVLVATGLWPMPAKTPLNAVVHDRVE